MQSERPPTLDYVRGREFPVSLSRILVCLSAYPWLALLSLHALYLVEWYVNAERPIPPHHGPDNVVERVLYETTALLILAAGPAFLVQVGVVAVFWFNGEMGGEAQRWPLGLMVRVVVLPAVSWLLAFAMLTADPFRAMYFFLD